MSSSVEGSTAGGLPAVSGAASLPLDAAPLNHRTCVWDVAEPPGYWHSHRCGKPAKGERDGHPVCGIHARVFDRRGFGDWWQP